jgi:hypothetical protein
MAGLGERDYRGEGITQDDAKGGSGYAGPQSKDMAMRNSCSA